MPIIRPGIEYELSVISTEHMFEAINELNNKIKERSWSYLVALGYNLHRRETIKTTLLERNKIKILRIEANFNYYTDHQVDIEVPLKQFEAIVPHFKSPKDD